VAQALPILRGVALRVTEALHPLPPLSDLKLLSGQMEQTAKVLPEVESALGLANKCASCEDKSAPSAMPTSEGS
jgi:hypothetical protein